MDMMPVNRKHQLWIFRNEGHGTIGQASLGMITPNFERQPLNKPFSALPRGRNALCPEP